jgi:hypothetical protein
MVSLAADGGDWWSGTGWRWEVKTGWRPYSDAHGEIYALGEFFLLDDDEVIEVQHQKLLRYMAFH